MSLSPRPAQSGMALIGAMLITVVVVAIAAKVAVRSLQDIAASTRLAEAAAAGEVFETLEQDSIAMLRADGLAAPVDSLDEDWARAALAVDTPGGHGTATLVDLQARFDLNALAFDPAGAGGDRSADAAAAATDEPASDAMPEGNAAAAGAPPVAAVGTSAPEATSAAAAAAGGPAAAPPGMQLVERSYASATGHETRYFDVVASDGSAADSGGTGAAPDAASPPDARAEQARAEAMASLVRVPALAASLAAQAGPGAAAGARGLTPQQIAIARFALLLRALELDDALVPAVLDWLDGDSDTRFPDGAEDEYYTELERPYRTGNRRFVALEELKLVRGVDAEVYARLAPHLTVLPARTTINVNTAAPQVLMSLSPAIDSGTAAQIVNAREVQAFHSVEQFMSLPALHGRPLLADGLGTTSEFFALAMLARSGRSELAALSVLARNDPATIELVSRVRGAFDE